MSAAPWSRERVELGDVPRMVSRTEQRYLHWLTRTQWRDVGHVVEIGSWLGGSTVCLAAGMRARGTEPRHRLYAFDRFLWLDFMADKLDLELRPGASFEPHFKRNVASFGDLVISRVVDLPDDSCAVRCPPGEADEPVAVFAWPASEPIEILFVDGAKSWRAVRHLFVEVGPSLLAGQTLIAAQDYKHWGSYWIPLFLWRIRRHLELEHDVMAGSTIAYRLVSPIPPVEIASLPERVSELDLEAALGDLDAAAAALADRGDVQGAQHVRLSRIHLLGHRGAIDPAIRLYLEMRESWPQDARPHGLAATRAFLLRNGARDLPEPPRPGLRARLWRELPRWLRS